MAGRMRHKPRSRRFPSIGEYFLSNTHDARIDIDVIRKASSRNASFTPNRQIHAQAAGNGAMGHGLPPVRRAGPSLSKRRH